jgi:deoxycytidylate deaminase
VYYRAKHLALGNGRPYHLAAILRRRGKVIKIGENTNKTHPRFKRQYSDETWGSHMHAEMNVLRFAQPGDEIEVIRFKKRSYERTMARPCSLCAEAIREAGIKSVKYTNWEGEWEVMKLW